ncbi:MAG: hypothetical protein JRJ56_05790 [Deltaproteobacteria bacterium]|nr:hypothetical protein [Deltaproteobacteria bacterium]
MKVVKLLLALSMLFCLVACGQVVKETVTPVPADKIVKAGKKIVVVPFADYTPDGCQDSYWRRNILLMEALQDEFSQYGLRTAIEEDVVRYLMDNGIISPPEVLFAGSPMNDYMKSMVESGNWSSHMSEMITSAVSHNEQLQLQKQQLEKGTPEVRTASLTSDQVIHLGNKFSADYIIRGRIIEFDQGDAKDNFNPFQIGLLPFALNTSQRALFGVARSDNYEMFDKMAMGGVAGLAFGHSNKNTPFDEDKDYESSGHPLFDPVKVSEDDYHELNTAFWGAMGTGLAFLSHNGGRVPRAVVQIRIMVQDAMTGNLIWTNRSQVEVTPKSVYSSQEYRVLVSRAIKQAAQSLVSNFIATCEPGLVPPKVDKAKCDGTAAAQQG